MARRSLEIGLVVAGAHAQGLGVAFGTLTVRHHRRQSLETVWGGVTAGWKRSTSGREWKVDRERAGLIGYARVQEVTHGQNGWHPHVHVLTIGEHLDTDADADELFVPMHRRWSAGVQSAGLAAPLPVGSEWHLVTGDLSGTKLGDYLTKGYDAAAAIGMEMTQTQSKIARAVHSTVPTWQLLDGAINGEVRPLHLWWEWEKASKGKRQIAWSQGLRERFGLLQERSDEEVAAEELGSREDVIVEIARKGWDQLVRHPELIPIVLEVAEAAGQAGLSAWLDVHEIEHRRV